MRKLFSFFIGSQPCLIRLLEGGKCPEILVALCFSNTASFRARKSDCVCTCDAPEEQRPRTGLLRTAASRCSLCSFPKAGIGGGSKTDVLTEEWKGIAPWCSELPLTEIWLENSSQERKEGEKSVRRESPWNIASARGGKARKKISPQQAGQVEKCLFLVQLCFTLRSWEQQQMQNWLCRRPAWGTSMFTKYSPPCPKFSVLVGRGCVAMSADFDIEINFALTARY